MTTNTPGQALLQGFLDTPYFIRHILSIQDIKTKGERITGSLAMLADEYILSFISLSAHIQSTEFYQHFCYLHHQPACRQTVFSTGCGSGVDIKKYQHRSKFWPLPTILRRL